MLMKSRHRVKLHWTTGPLDPWTIELFSGPFFYHFLGPYFGYYLDPFFFRTILTGKGRPLVLRKGGRQIVVTGVGLGCSLSVLREGWKVNCCYWRRAGGGRGGKLLY